MKKSLIIPIVISLSPAVCAADLGIRANDANPAWVDQGIAVMQTPSALSRSFFGIEYPSTAGQDEMTLQAGFWRIRPSGSCSWREINVAPGVFNWAALDAQVAAARALGLRVILPLGGTPEWAATDPTSGDPRWGAGSSSRPRDLSTWSEYVYTLSSRYRQQIDAYEIWPEADSFTCWSDDMTTLAEMTRLAYFLIKSNDPSATVICASMGTRRIASQSHIANYYAALKAEGYPFDAWGLLGYPDGPDRETHYLENITIWQELVVRVVGDVQDPALAKPVFDLSLNFGLPGPRDLPGNDHGGEQTVEMMLNGYAAAAGLGIDVCVWNGYESSFFDQPLGACIRPDDGSADAFNWMVTAASTSGSIPTFGDWQATQVPRFVDWLAEHGLSSTLSGETRSSRGYPLLLHFAYGVDPDRPIPAKRLPHLQGDGSGGPTFRFAVPKAAVGVTITPEFSASLGGAWSNMTAQAEWVGEDATDAYYEVSPPSDSQTGFFRLHLAQ